jgi:hypothetical protein
MTVRADLDCSDYEDRMLAIVRDNPSASQAHLAMKMGWTLPSGRQRQRAARALFLELKANYYNTNAQNAVFMSSREASDPP